MAKKDSTSTKAEGSSQRVKIEKVHISKVSLNDENPRIIKDDKFKKLVKSIQDFPQMLEIRPIVVDEGMMILGGNMRYQACKEAGMDYIYIIRAENLTSEQKREFVIKDNASFGEWDWDILANEWNSEELDGWGIDVWQAPEEEVDYSLLDELDDAEVEKYGEGLRKAIQIEFTIEDHEAAAEMIKELRAKDVYIGAIVLDALKKFK